MIHEIILGIVGVISVIAGACLVSTGHEAAGVCAISAVLVWFFGNQINKGVNENGKNKTGS